MQNSTRKKFGDNPFLNKIREKNEYIIIVILIIFFSMYSLCYNITKKSISIENPNLNLNKKLKFEKNNNIPQNKLKKIKEADQIRKIKNRAKIDKKTESKTKMKTETKTVKKDAVKKSIPPSSFLEMVDKKGKVIYKEK